MKKVVIIFLSVSLIMLLTIPTFAAEKRFEKIYSNDCADYFLDIKTVRQVKTLSTIDIWVKIVYNNPGKEEAIKYRKKLGLSLDGYKYLDYSMVHYQISQKENQCQILQFADYNKNDSLLQSVSFSSFLKDFTTIIPGTAEETIYEGTLKLILEKSKSKK